MLRSLIILTIILVANSCTVNHHLNRSKRQLDKAIEKGYVLSIDSVYVNDTTYIPKIEHDTTFLFKPGDTIEIERERLRYKIIRDIRTDSIFIDVECRADTIYKEVLVQVNCDPIYIQETFLQHLGIKKTWQKILFFVALIAVIIIILMRRARAK